MKIYFVRHGEPTYDMVSRLHYIGHGRSLAPLTDLGRAQAEQASLDPRLREASLIVSSPYTRALQTAAILSKNLGLEIRVEVALHEWMPDTTSQFDSGEYAEAASNEYYAKNGIRDDSCRYPWEDKAHLYDRVHSWLAPYQDCDCIIAVCHGMVIRQFYDQQKIAHCEIIEVQV